MSTSLPQYASDFYDSDETFGPTFRDEEGEASTLAAEFSTATMGHVLLGQGRAEEALAVFRAVLARNPDDDDARRGVSLLTAPSKSDPPPAASTVAAAEDEDLRTWARALPVDPHTLALYWNLRAEDLLQVGANGRTSCALVVVSHRIGPWGLERAERLVEHLPRAGERVEGTLTDGAMHHLAVGVFVEGVFVPVARAVPVSTPPAALPTVLASAAEALPVLLPPRVVFGASTSSAYAPPPGAPSFAPPSEVPASTTPDASSPESVSSATASPVSPQAAPSPAETPAAAPVSLPTEPDPILYAFFAAAWARGVSSSPTPSP